MDDSIASNSTTRRKTQNRFRFDGGLNFNQKMTATSLSHIQKKYNFNTTSNFNSRDRKPNQRSNVNNSHHPNNLLGKTGGGFGFGEKIIKNNLVKVEGIYGMGATTNSMTRQLPTISQR